MPWFPAFRVSFRRTPLRRTPLLTCGMMHSHPLTVNPPSAQTANAELASGTPDQMPPPNGLFSIQGQVVIVTGATGALAGSAARYLAQQGATVVLISRSGDKIEQAVAALTAEGLSASGHACDVTDRPGLQAAAEAVLARYGRIDGLVNGAGGNRPGANIGPNQSLFDLNLDDYDTVLDLNLKGTLLPSLVFGQSMVTAGRGSIVNFSSASSTHALTRVLGYSNAKAAVDNLTRWMATEFALRHGDGLRVNAVCPGFFIGDQNRALLLAEDGSLTARGQKIIANTPMGRFGEAPEVNGAIHYLLSPASSFVTGTILTIDGGFNAFSGV